MKEHPWSKKNYKNKYVGSYPREFRCEVCREIKPIGAKAHLKWICRACNVFRTKESL